MSNPYKLPDIETASDEEIVGAYLHSGETEDEASSSLAAIRSYLPHDVIVG